MCYPKISTRLFLSFFCLLLLSSCSTTPALKSSKYIKNKKENKKIIVFVHGVLGDVDETWTNDENKKEPVYWPDLVAKDKDPILKDYNVFAFSYYSTLFKKAPTITELGSDLNVALKTAEIITDKLSNRYEEIIFVGHSMGNLVVRSALINRALYRNVKVPLIVSFAAPYDGGPGLLNIAKLFTDNPQYQSMLESDYNDFLQCLNQSWLSQTRFTEIVCASEGQKNSILGEKVVKAGSATKTCTRIKENKEFSRHDHQSIVKPAKIKDDAIHDWLKLQINQKRPQWPRKVVLMDEASKSYCPDKDTGVMNMHHIQDNVLKDFNLQIIHKPIYKNWNQHEEITKENPDLIIMHYSSFAKKPFQKKGVKSFTYFIERVLHTKAKFIIYSRYKLGSIVMKENIFKGDLNFVPLKDRERFQFFDIHEAKYNDIPESERCFKNIPFSGDLRSLVKTALDF